MIRLFTALTLVLAASLGHAQEMQPGRWEIVTAMKMQGMAMPGGRMTHCYTKQDLAAGKQYSSGDSQCAISNMKSSGGNISYDLACAMEGGKMVGSVKGTMSPTAYTFEQNLRMTPDQGIGEMQSTIKGRRLGDCK